MHGLKKCCFNCNKCSTAPDNQLVCKKPITKEILKHMDIDEACEQCCGKYEEDSDMPDPYE
jgi:hypothetical protein